MLEYSEEQQAFHNNTGDRQENTNGYKTLGKVSFGDSFKFVEYVRGFEIKSKISYNEIKELFDDNFKQI